MITRDNYEVYFVDYLEGNLPENEIDQFLDFLNQNPDLKEELHLFEEVVLPEESFVFDEKEKLHKKTADEIHRFENKAIAYLEGDLNDNDQKLFESYIAAQPKLQKEYELFAKTKLVPDLSIQFQAKNKLYRKSARTIVLNWVARAAAVVVFVWGISSLLQTPDKPQIAQSNFKPDKSKTEEIQTERPQEISQQASTHVKAQEMVNKKIKPYVQKQLKDVVQEKAIDHIVIQEKAIEPKEQLAVLIPINAQIEKEIDIQLAAKQGTNITPINETPRVLSAEDFLAMRAKKIGKEGLFSAQRLARLGLSVASELSGERIGYKEKDGKITSVEFESKLLAFSIPLEKK